MGAHPGRGPSPISRGTLQRPPFSGWESSPSAMFYCLARMRPSRVACCMGVNKRKTGTCLVTKVCCNRGHIFVVIRIYWGISHPRLDPGVLSTLRAHPAARLFPRFQTSSQPRPRHPTPPCLFPAARPHPPPSLLPHLRSPPSPHSPPPLHSPTSQSSTCCLQRSVSSRGQRVYDLYTHKGEY